MRILHVVALSFCFGILSCQSVEKSKILSTSKTDGSLTLEYVVSQWNQSMADLSIREPAAKINWQEELFRICVKQENLCEYNLKSPKKRDSFNKKVISQIRKAIEEEKFDDLAAYSVDLSLKYFGKYRKNILMDFADHILHDSTCRTIEMKHALASTMEDYLPDYQVKTAVQTLYEMNSQCPMSRATAMSSYRAAMLRLVDQDCSKALPLLEKVTTSSEDYLKPRSLYWSWRCQGQSPAVKAMASNQLPYFSYHRILMEESPASMKIDDSGPFVEQTPVSIETQKNSYLNDAARLAEKLMAGQNTFAARAVLERIRVERIQEVEPDFQVYWAHLLHITQSGIRKFQILSNIINNYPQYRSKSVQNMLFPTWYFEHVESNSKKLDPWLVQALIRQESAFDPRAKSRVGATGLMQLMPGTARRIIKTRGHLGDPIYNVQAGIRFLEKLVKRFDGQIHLALAAYNAGPARVEEWQKRYPTDDPMLFIDTIPYRETREYVAFILRNYYWYRSLNTRSHQSENEVTTESLGRVATQPEPY